MKFKPDKKTTQPFLTESQKKKRLKFAYRWRNNHVKLYNHMPIMFTDEKIFTVNGSLNKQNERVYATSRENANLHYGNILKV